MARYKYVCTAHGEIEVVKAMAEYDRYELCPECGWMMVRVFEVDGVQFMNRGGLAGTRSMV